MNLAGKKGLGNKEADTEEQRENESACVTFGDGHHHPIPSYVRVGYLGGREEPPEKAHRGASGGLSLGLGGVIQCAYFVNIHQAVL